MSYSKYDEEFGEDYLFKHEKCRFQSPNETTVKLTAKLRDRIKEDPEFSRSKCLQIILLIQDILRCSFEEDEFSMESLEICKEIFFTLKRNFFEYQPKRSLKKTGSNGHVPKDPYCSEETSSIFCGPHSAEEEFPYLHQNLSNSNLVKFDENQTSNVEPNLKTIRLILNQIISNYRKQWTNDRRYEYSNFPISCTGLRKLTRSLSNYEEYIIRILRNKWSKVERKVCKVSNPEMISKMLAPIYLSFCEIQRKSSTESDKNKNAEDNFEIFTSDELSSIEPENSPVLLEKTVGKSSETLESARRIHTENAVKDIFINANFMEIHDTTMENNNIESRDNDVQYSLSVPSVEKIYPKDIIFQDSWIEFQTTTSSGTINGQTIENISSPVELMGDDQSFSFDLHKTRWKDQGLEKWLHMLENLLLKGIINVGDIFMCTSRHHRDFFLTDGRFGPIEIGLTKDFDAIAVKRLSKGGWNQERCLELTESFRILRDLTSPNILNSFVTKNHDDQYFLCTPLCNCNLDDYLSNNHVSEDFPEKAKNLSFQISQGLAVLHSHIPIIVHGNLKPGNIFINEFGILKLADFGIFKHLFKTTDVISDETRQWWSTESQVWYKFTENYSSSTMSDIQVCGILFFYINSKGDHPYGRTAGEIVRNLETNNPNISVSSTSLWGLLNMMYYTNPSQRPGIVEVYNHIYFWNEERRWEFLKECLLLANIDYDPIDPLRARKFCATLEENWTNDSMNFRWITSALKYFSQIEIPEKNRSEMGLNLVHFLNKCHHEDPETFNKPHWVLQAFPDLPSQIYNALRGTHWFEVGILKKFNPLTTHEHLW